MHCLFISSLLPEPEPRTGFEIANRAILSAFADAGARVTAVGFRRPGGPAPRAGEILLGDLAIENAGAGGVRKALWVGKALAANLPVSAAKLRVLSDTALRTRLSSAGAFDALILNSVQMPAAYPFLLDLAPCVFVAHNVEHVSARENAASAASPVSRLLYGREAHLLKRIETRLCARATAVHTLTEADLGPLGLRGDTRALVLPLSVGRAQGPDDGGRAQDVGLIGTWSWAPNRVGLDWFLREVAPLLPSDITVRVAGAIDGPAPSAPANVAFLGRVPDAQGFVRGSRVVAIATRGGTGVQLKTLEVLEEGMPAVATTPALRGIDGARPANLRIADDPRSFAAALVSAIAADRDGQAVRLDGRAFAQQRRSQAVEAARRSLARLAAAAASRAQGDPS